MLTLGMPTLIELPDIEDCARLCRELGLQFVELSMCLPQYQTDRMDIRRLQTIADQNGIFYTIHLDDTNTHRHIARLYHMHLHDAIPTDRRDHLPIGEGILPIEDYLTLAKAHNCRVVVEVKTISGLHRSIHRLRQYDTFILQ